MSMAGTRAHALRASLLVASAGVAAHAGPTVATATWTGAGANQWSSTGSWDGLMGGALFPNNDGGFVYNVFIQPGSATTITMDVDDPVTVQDLTTSSNTTLDILGGHSLTVVDDASLAGFIGVNNSSFDATAPGAAFGGNSARLQALGGGTIAIGATTYDGRGIQSGDIFRAVGAGSLIDLSSLQSMDFFANFTFALTRRISAAENAVIDLSSVQTLRGGSGDDTLEFNISTGAMIDLSSLQSTTDGNTRFNVDVLSYSLDSLTNAVGLSFDLIDSATLNLNALQTQNGGSYFVPAGGTVNLGAVTSLTNTAVDIGAGGVFNAPNLTNVSGSSITLGAGQTFVTSAITQADNARLHARDGRTLAIADTLLDMRGVDSGTFLSAQGTDGGAARGVSPSVLDLSSVQEINNAANFTFALTRRISATAGGVVDLSNLTSLIGGTGDDWLEVFQDSGGEVLLGSLSQVSNNARFIAEGASTMDLGALVSQSGGAYVVGSGSTVNLGSLNALNNASVSIEALGSFIAPTLTDFSGSSITLGADQTFTTGALVEVNNASLHARDGRTLAVADTDYVGTGVTSGTFLSAQGSGSILDLSSIETLSNNVNGTFQLTRTIEATAGGYLDLSGLETVLGATGDDTLRFRAASNGVVNLASLQQITTGNVRFDVESEGRMILGDLTITSNLDVALTDATSTLEVNGSLLLDSGATLSVGQASRVNIRENFSLQLTDPGSFVADTGVFVFDGVGDTQLFEVAGEDNGLPGDPNPTGNFGLGQMVIGSEAAASRGGPTVVELLDVIDNGGSADTEALYLYGLGGDAGLRILDGATLIIHNINVYYFDPDIDGFVHLNSLFEPGQDVIAFEDGLVRIPAPATGVLALLGAPLLMRRRR